jgi:DNA-3-methyladenine glycosylase II
MRGRWDMLQTNSLPKAVAHLKSADPRLGEVIARVGPYRPQYLEPKFSTLARSIVYQQLSGKAALTIYSRLQAAMAPEGVCPTALMGLTKERLRALGLSNQKASYLLDLAGRSLDKTVEFERLPEMEDEDVISHLTSVKGVGVWTAHMFLMFALKRPDVLPTGDLGVRKAVQKLYRLRKPPMHDRMVQIARPWRPYSSVACWYLWRSLDNVAAL